MFFQEIPIKLIHTLAYKLSTIFSYLKYKTKTLRIYNCNCIKLSACSSCNATFSVPFRGPPSYNPKRRSGIGLLTRAPSLSTLNLPPSPCPSDRSSLPFSSASSSLSDGSVPPEIDTASIVTGKVSLFLCVLYFSSSILLIT